MCIIQNRHEQTAGCQNDHEFFICTHINHSFQQDSETVVCTLSAVWVDILFSCLYNVKDLAFLRGLDLMPYRLYAFIMPVKPVYIIKDKLFSRVAIRHLFKDPAGVIAACSILE